MGNAIKWNIIKQEFEPSLGFEISEMHFHFGGLGENAEFDILWKRYCEDWVIQKKW